MCGAHPRRGKTLPRQLRGSRVIQSCCNASVGADFWAGAEQSQHQALRTSPAYMLQCFTVPIPTLSALDICVSSQSQGTLAPVTSNRGLKPRSVLVRVSAAALLCRRSHPRLPLFQVQTGRRAGGFLKTTLPVNLDIRGENQRSPLTARC